MELVLASASPRRSLLLATAGYPHDIRAPDIDEAMIEGESPAEAVLRLSEAMSLKAAPSASAKALTATKATCPMNTNNSLPC